MKRVMTMLFAACIAFAGAAYAADSMKKDDLKK
jgi:hypothetical protein